MSLYMHATSILTLCSFVYNCSESEDFENQAIVRVDTLLKDAYAMRESKEAEKTALVDRLKRITSILDTAGKHMGGK